MTTDHAAPAIPRHVAERVVRQALAHGTPVGPRIMSVLLDDLDAAERELARVPDGPVTRRAAAQLVIDNDHLRSLHANALEIGNGAMDDRDRAEAKLADAERGRDELNDRVGALTDELSEVQHDRQVLATENGALRDELDQTRSDLAAAEADLIGRAAEVRIVELERDTAAAELAAARRQLDAAEARDHERARQAMLDNDRDGAV